MRGSRNLLCFLCLMVLLSLGMASGPVLSQPPVRFVDVTESAGVAFRHVNGSSGRKYFVETMGAGACFFDYDDDGRVDLYAVNGRPLPGFRSGETPTNRLYRNNGDGTFTDVTGQAGVDGGSGYGMGCAAADYDNDGDQDLFVTNFGTSVLYRNEGGGRFTDVTALAGVGGAGWQTGCAFGDYDNDGDLDLFVARYVSYTLAESRKKLIPYTAHPGRSLPDVPAYPAPVNFEGASSVLYRNEGDGRFTDVTRAAGVYSPEGKSLGAVFSDLDDDGLLDILVANDGARNFLYRNRGMTFEDVALLAGVAYDAEGATRAGMGVDVGDYDGDGRLDVVVTNFRYQGILLFRNDGSLSFTDASLPAGLRAPSLPYVGWGVALFDCDNDGRLDLFAADGHVLDNAEVFDPGAEYAQPNLLLRNDGPAGAGSAAFTNVSRASGPGLSLRKVSRGAAFGDFDDDGDVDVFVVNNNERADLLRNEGGNRNHWLKVKLVGGAREGRRQTADGRPHPPPGPTAQPVAPMRSRPPPSLPREREGASRALSPALGEGEVSSRLSNRDGIGARVTVVSGGRRQVQEVRAGSSYLSCNDRRLHFGLGRSSRADLIEVRWPGGARTQVRDVGADQEVTVEEGRGLAR